MMSGSRPTVLIGGWQIELTESLGINCRKDAETATYLDVAAVADGPIKSKGLSNLVTMTKSTLGLNNEDLIQLLTWIDRQLVGHEEKG